MIQRIYWKSFIWVKSDSAESWTAPVPIYYTTVYTFILYSNACSNTLQYAVMASLVWDLPKSVYSLPDCMYLDAANVLYRSTSKSPSLSAKDWRQSAKPAISLSESFTPGISGIRTVTFPGSVSASFCRFSRISRLSCPVYCLCFSGSAIFRSAKMKSQKRRFFFYLQDEFHIKNIDISFKAALEIVLEGNNLILQWYMGNEGSAAILDIIFVSSVYDIGSVRYPTALMISL